MREFGGQSKRIVMAVDDDPFVLMLAEEMLEDAGFHVITASNADEALQALCGRHDVEAIFTDIDMPGSMNGVGLAIIVARRWPDVKIVVTSGYVRKDQGDLPVNSRFFAKPYDVTRVASHLREAVGA